jgi:hypothetical protein
MSASTPPAPVLSGPDLADPLFAIEHLARLFLVEVDTAREFTYRDDFPQPIKVGRRWLWFPEEVLAWTRQQPRFSVAQRKRTPAPAPAARTLCLRWRHPGGNRCPTNSNASTNDAIASDQARGCRPPPAVLS